MRIKGILGEIANEKSPIFFQGTTMQSKRIKTKTKLGLNIFQYNIYDSLHPSE